MGNHGILEARIELSNISIVHVFELVNKKVDIPCDGILGRDFLQRKRANFCHESQTVTFNGETCKMVDKIKQLEAREPNMRKVGQIKLPPRTESIMRVPETQGSLLVGMTKKCEIQEGVIIAATLTKVVDGYVMTSILNTNDIKLDMQEQIVEVDEVDSVWDRSCSTQFESHHREGERERF